MGKGLKHYDGSEKKAHRHRLWQEVRRKLKVPIRTARVLYLLGPDPMDWIVLKRKGFLKAKIWGIDLSDGAVLAARKQGLIAMRVDAFDLLMYGRGLRFDAVYLDLCCGLTSEVVKLMAATMLSDVITTNTVFAINLLRGRESNGVFPMNDEIHRWVDAAGNVGLHKKLIKHRGFMFVMELVAIVSRLQVEFRRVNGLPPIMVRDYMERLLTDASSMFLSYRSGVQRMDSVICYASWNNPGGASFGRIEAACAASVGAKIVGPEVTKTRRLLAAAKAVETMRLGNHKSKFVDRR